MDGFKNSTKTQYSSGGSVKGNAVRGAAKVGKVMGEFKSGTLHSGSSKGPKVTSKTQATAIALSEARKAGANVPVKKSVGGLIKKAASLGAFGLLGKAGVGQLGALSPMASLLDRKRAQDTTDTSNAGAYKTGGSVKKGC